MKITYNKTAQGYRAICDIKGTYDLNYRAWGKTKLEARIKLLAKLKV